MINLKEPPLGWILLNLDQSVMQRQTKFKTLQNQNYKIGNNILSNHLCVVNDRIELDWLNLSLPSIKIKCKQLFLQLNDSLTGQLWHCNNEIKTKFITIHFILKIVIITCIILAHHGFVTCCSIMCL